MHWRAVGRVSREQRCLLTEKRCVKIAHIAICSGERIKREASKTQRPRGPVPTPVEETAFAPPNHLLLIGEYPTGPVIQVAPVHSLNTFVRQVLRAWLDTKVGFVSPFFCMSQQVMPGPVGCSPLTTVVIISRFQNRH